MCHCKYSVIAVLTVLRVQTFTEGYDAMLEPPGSYCGYASLYLTSCLIRYCPELTYNSNLWHLLTTCALICVAVVLLVEQNIYSCDDDI